MWCSLRKGAPHFFCRQQPDRLLSTYQLINLSTYSLFTIHYSTPDLSLQQINNAFLQQYAVTYPVVRNAGA
jgi:hypothetical protein